MHLFRHRRKRSETGETDLEVTVELDFQKNTSLTSAVVASTLQDDVAEFGLEGLELVTREGATVVDTYIEDAGTDYKDIMIFRLLSILNVFFQIGFALNMLNRTELI